MPSSYIFGGNTGLTYEDIKRNRELIDAMLGSRQAPTDVGSGLNFLGQSILVRSLMGQNKEAWDQGVSGATSDFNSFMGGIPSWGGGGYSAPTTFSPSGSPELITMARQVAAENGVPEDLFMRLIQQESSWNPQAQSPAGALGLGQLMPATAQELGVTDPYDPYQNMSGAARYLRQQLDDFGDPSLALAAYNAGPGAVREAGGIPPFAETQNYVNAILGGGGGFSGGGLNPNFSSSLEAMIAAAPPEIRDAISLSSGYRTPDEQAQIISGSMGKYGFGPDDQAAWAADVQALGPIAAGQKWADRFSASGMRQWIALPGSSQHQRGMAGDLTFGNDAARDWAHQNAGAYGLNFPLGNEPWHVELAGARGGQVPNTPSFDPLERWRSVDLGQVMELAGNPYLNDVQRSTLNAIMGQVLEAQMTPPVSMMPQQAPEVFTINGVSSVWDAQNGRFVPIPGFDAQSGDYEMRQDVNGRWRYATGPNQGQLVFPDVAAGTAGGDIDIEGETALRKEFYSNPIVKDFQATRMMFERVQAGAGDTSGAHDISMIYAYMKMLDPNSTILPGEYATARQAGTIPEQLVGLYNSMIETGGFLTDTQRRQFLRQAAAIYNSQLPLYTQVADQYRGYATDYRLEPSRIAPSFDAFDASVYQEIPEWSPEALPPIESIEVMDLPTIEALIEGIPEGREDELDQALRDAIIGRYDALTASGGPEEPPVGVAGAGGPASSVPAPATQPPAMLSLPPTGQPVSPNAPQMMPQVPPQVPPQGAPQGMPPMPPMTPPPLSQEQFGNIGPMPPPRADYVIDPETGDPQGVTIEMIRRMNGQELDALLRSINPDTVDAEIVAEIILRMGELGRLK